MNKLPITAMCMCKDGLPYLYYALKSVDFCERKIFLDDHSTDGSRDIAVELGWEVYDWTGPNSMCERRNYIVGHDGWWQGNMPKITIESPWTLQVDADEVFEPDLGKKLKEFLDVYDTPDIDAVGFKLVNIYTSGEQAGQKMTGVPLQRMFRTGKVHWEHDIQNDVKFDGATALVDAEFIHYGYGSWEDHWEKQWGRLEANEERLLKDPDNLISRGYLINCLAVTGERDVINLERLVAQISIAVDQFKKGDVKDKANQAIVERIIRHSFSVCMNSGRIEEFLWMLSQVEEHISWIPDVQYWKLCCGFRGANIDIDKVGREFFKNVEAFRRPPVEVIELQSEDKEVEVCQEIYKIISQALFEGYSRRDDVSAACKILEWWRKKLVYVQFLASMKQFVNHIYKIDDLKRVDKEILSAEFVHSGDEVKERVFHKVVEMIT